MISAAAARAKRILDLPICEGRVSKGCARAPARRLFSIGSGDLDAEAAAAGRTAGGTGLPKPGRPVPRWRGLVGVRLPATEQQPIEGDVLLHGEGDQEVSMRGRAVFVTIDVLLKDAQ